MSDPTSETFGACLYRVRRARDLSQQGAAALLGVARPYLSRLENGRQQPPPPKTAERWAAALQLDDRSRQQLLAACLSERDGSDLTPEAARVFQILRRAGRHLPPVAVEQLRQLERTLEGSLIKNP